MDDFQRNSPDVKRSNREWFWRAGALVLPSLLVALVVPLAVRRPFNDPVAGSTTVGVPELEGAERDSERIPDHVDSWPSVAETDRLSRPQWLPPLLAIDGCLHTIGESSSRRAAVIVFLGMDCPISNGYLPELNRLHKRFESAGIQFVGVLSDPFITPSEALRFRDEFELSFPVVRDGNRDWQRSLSATHTPQAVVVNAARQIVYSGRIDNRYVDLARPKQNVSRRDLEVALQHIAAGQTPEVQRTQPIGCRLSEPKPEPPDGQVTFTREIAPIIFANCTVCHRAGEATPFPLTEYQDVVRHGAQIADVVGRRMMPPWKPVPGFGRFKNEQRLNDDQIALIRDWVQNGMPEGNREDLPAAPSFAQGWQLGEPDLILEMPAEFEIPADGPDIYQHFVLPTATSSGRLIAAFEFRPGNAAVVHHSFLYFDVEGEARKLDAAQPGPGYEHFGGPGFVPWGSLGGWGPGGRPRRLPPGTGRRMPPAADLVLQVHYHPTGKREVDRSRVGLYFAPPNARSTVTEIMVSDVDLVIPAGARRHRLGASYVLPVPVQLLDATPHMHLLGREIRVWAELPNGENTPLIRIDDWNFYWQDHYEFDRPVALPAGTRIRMEAFYDNSAENPQNPHSPPRTVRFGEYSDDEMGICYFQVLTETVDDLDRLNRDVSRYFSEMLDRYEHDQDRRDPADAAAPVLSEAQTGSKELQRQTNTLGISFVRIPAGSFWMGDDDTERFGTYSLTDGPRHRVSISKPFWMSQHEITVGQFERFVEQTGYVTHPESSSAGCFALDPVSGQVQQTPECSWRDPGFEQSEQHPVVAVSWADANAFCRWLSKSEGRAYRLPTEAEWEYACRAGTETMFETGDRIESLQGYANLRDMRFAQANQHASGRVTWDDGYACTAPVGSYRPNGFGLYDLHGNVGEWCGDWFEPYTATGGLQTDPQGPQQAAAWRVVRGGSWFNAAASLRCAARHDGVPTAASTTNGFRIVLEIPASDTAK